MDSGLRKTGSNDTLKTQILTHFLDGLTHRQVTKYADDGLVLSSSKIATGAPEEPAQPKLSKPPAEKPAQTPNSCASNKPEEFQIVESNGEDHGASGSGEGVYSDPVLFGRQTFDVDGKAVEDKTSYFAAIEEGPDIQEDAEQTVMEVMEEATDGIIPLAACIKITQAYQEVYDDLIALLLGGAFFSSSKSIGILIRAAASPNSSVTHGHMYMYLIFFGIKIISVDMR